MTISLWNHDSRFGRVTRLWAEQLRYHGSIFSTNKKLSNLQIVIPALGSAQFHIQCVLGVRHSGHEADHLPPLSGEVKNERSYTSSPPICLHSMQRESFILSPGCKNTVTLVYCVWKLFVLDSSFLQISFPHRMVWINFKHYSSLQTGRVRFLEMCSNISHLASFF